MTTPRLFAWLDEKMDEYGSGKLIPPPDVLEDELADHFERKVRTELTEQILREADLERRVVEAIALTETPKAATLERDIRRLFEQEPEREWRHHIEVVVANLKIRKLGEQA